MSDEVKSESEIEVNVESVETPPSEEIEIQVGDAPSEETKPSVVTLTPEEFAALQSKGDSAQAVIKGLESLSTKLGVQPSTGTPPMNAPQQTPEEFFAEHADDIFDHEKGAKTLAEYNKRVIERDYGPMISNLASQLANTRKELLESKDPVFKKYASEIDALVKAQPAAVQMQPDVYERALLTIREKHRTEIEKETIDSKVTELVNAKLKELGIDTDAKVEKRPPAYVNSEGRSIPSGATRKTVRLPDAATKRALEAEALRRGLELSDLLKAKGYLNG